MHTLGAVNHTALIFNSSINFVIYCLVGTSVRIPTYSHGCTGFAYAYAEGSLFYPRALPPKKYDPDETKYQETLLFYLQPLERTLFSPKLMANIPRSNSIWTTLEYSPLDYTPFFISSTRHKKRKPMLVHANVTKKSTLYRSIFPPQAHLFCNV